MNVKVLKTKEKAKEIGEFLTGPNAFEQTWAPNEKEFVMRAPLDSLNNDKCCYWYVEDENGKVIAALGVRENKLGSGGYEMDEDYIAVHKNYRNKGLAKKLLLEMERFVQKNKGRYIHVLTCDIESYFPARKFYEKHGYNKVAEIPNYYVKNEGRIDYFKEL